MAIERMVEDRHVRLVNDPTRIGFLTGREMVRQGRRMVQVVFHEGTRWVPEDQVEKIGTARLSPLDMLEIKKLGRPVDLRRALTHVKLSGRLANVIYSMEATNTAFYAYQFKPVLKILDSPTNSILVADEVGLGKTIEAGLVWTELRARFDMRRLLVICPAALREKWHYELSTKMGVTAQICDAREVLEVIRDESLQSRGFAVVASMQGLRPPRGWEEDNVRGAAAELARFFRSMESESRLVDLLVIDEAHHLRSPETQTNELGYLCKSISEYTVFLTATPIHNRNQDLLSLLHLLDPDTFARPEAFAQILDANKPLVRARDLVLQPSQSFDHYKLCSLLQEARRHPLLRSNRQLAMIEQNVLTDKHLDRREKRSKLAYQLETVNLLAHVINRTRKRDVTEWRVVREVVAEFVELEAIERKFYDLVSGVVMEYARRRAANERFLLAQPQRQMTSSMAAALRLWQKRLVELEEAEGTGDIDEDETRHNALGPLVTEIVHRSRGYVELDRLVKIDTKYRRLREILVDFLRQYPGEKVVVFSTFHATLDYLAERLKTDEVSCIRLRAGQRETKSDTIKRFTSPDGPSVLLSSEVGGEGFDLQFSRVLINYDLPWNPMRVDQRIGRIDRLGQEAERVTIWNILYANTIDARIYKRLYEKLDLCRTALGDLEAVIGDEIRRLEIDLISRTLSPEQQELRLEQTAQALENRRLQEQHLENDATSLVAYGDYILGQVHAARELNRWISGVDIQRYVSDYLYVHYPGSEMRQVEPGALIFEVELSDKARLHLTEYIRKQRISHPTRLASGARSVRCRFDSRIPALVRQTDEVISQLHPLVRMIAANITEGKEELTPAVSLVLNHDAVAAFPIPPGVYILAVVCWSFRGLQHSEKLSYAATSLEYPDRILEADHAEILAAAAVSHGKDWLEVRNVVDLERAHAVANDPLLARLDREYKAYVDELKARNDDRADLQLHTLEQHFQGQKTRLQETAEKHRFAGRASLVSATEGRIRALHRRVEQQRLRIEEGRRIHHDAREIALAVIRVDSTRGHLNVT